MGYSKWSEIEHKGEPRTAEERARDVREIEALTRRYNRPHRRLLRALIRR